MELKESPISKALDDWFESLEPGDVGIACFREALGGSGIFTLPAKLFSKKKVAILHFHKSRRAAKFFLELLVKFSETKPLQTSVTSNPVTIFTHENGLPYGWTSVAYDAVHLNEGTLLSNELPVPRTAMFGSIVAFSVQCAEEIKEHADLVKWARLNGAICVFLVSVPRNHSEKIVVDLGDLNQNKVSVHYVH